MSQYPNEIKTAPRRRHLRRSLVLAAFAVVFAIIAGGLALPYAAVHFVTSQLRQAGFEGASIQRIDPGFKHIRLYDISLDADKKNTIGFIDVAIGKGFKPSAIILDKTGIDVDLTGLPDAIVIGNRVFPLGKNETASTPAALPILIAPVITAKQLTVRLVTDQGVIPLRFNGVLTQKGTALSLDGEIQTAADIAEVTAGISAQTDGSVHTVSLDIKDGRIIYDDLRIRRLSGWVNVRQTPQSGLSVESDITAGAVNIGDILLQAVQATYTATQDRHHLLANWKAPMDAGSFALDAEATMREDILSIEGKADATLKDLAALRSNLSEGNDEGTAENVAPAKSLPVRGRAAFSINFSAKRPAALGYGDLASGWDSMNGAVSVTADNVIFKKDASPLDATGKAYVTRQTNGDISLSSSEKISLSYGGTKLSLSPVSKNSLSVLMTPDRKLSLQIPSLQAASGDTSATVKQITASASPRSGSTSLDVFTLETGDITLVGNPPPLLPLRLSAKAHTTQNGYSFSGEATETQGRFFAEFKGTQTNAGTHINFDIPEVRYMSGVNDATDIFPILGEYADSVTGTLGAAGKIAVKNGTVNGTADILVKNVTVTKDDKSAKAVNAVITVSDISPLRIEKQSVAVGEINAGIPLTDGLTVFSLSGADSAADVHETQWTLANGKLSSAPFRFVYGPKRQDITVNLSAENVDLLDLSKLAAMDGLVATGTVNGKLPVTITKDNKIRIANGSLSTSAPGLIKYDPANPPDFLKNQTQDQIIDLKAALRNFQYEKLDLMVDSSAGEHQVIKLRALGKNPDFYDGHPIDLKLNLEGALENVLKSTVGTFTLDDAIRRQIENYETRKQ